MIYFDNAATTRALFADCSVDQRGPEKATGLEAWGNPSAPHALGRAAERSMAQASGVFAEILGCAPEEVYYTSGGTESNNLALLGYMTRFKKRSGQILAAPAEHPSVSEPLKRLSAEGFHITVAPPEKWIGLLESDTVLATFSHVHNETGELRDVAMISSVLKEKNPGMVVHVDGSQGFLKEPADLSTVDMYTLSAHKCHGPGGVGALMARRGVKLAPLVLGGGQQSGLRPGTENVAGILSFARAVQTFCPQLDTHHRRVLRIRDILCRLKADLPEVYVNLPGCVGEQDATRSTNPGRVSKQDDLRPANPHGAFSPYILNMSFMGVKGETLVHALSAQEIYISMGTACRTRKNDRSPLLALGFDQARADSAVRFSFSPFNTEEEAEIVRQAVIQTVTDLRRPTGKSKKA